MLTYLLTLPSKQCSMCTPILHQSSASIVKQTALACPSCCRSSWSQQSEQSLVMHPSTYCVAQMHSQTAQEQMQQQTALWKTGPLCQAHQQQQLWQPQDGHAAGTNQPQSTGKCLLQPLEGLNEAPQAPPPLQFLYLNVNDLNKTKHLAQRLDRLNCRAKQSQVSTSS